MDDMATDTAYLGATLIDGTGAPPLRDAAVVVADGRIAWTGPVAAYEPADDVRVVDLAGKHLIPGMLDANVHLLLHCDADVLLRYEPGAYDELIAEAAQVTLRAGFTTVMDTWGPLEALKRVRDRVSAGELIGSRIYLAGNIIGNGGPWSPDFYPDLGRGVATGVVEAVNRHWTHNVGAELTWMPAEQVREEVREYIATSGIDFVKFASSSHALSRFLALSPDAQRAIVEEAHAAGMTAQACTQAPEALKVTIEAGVDLLQHGNLTGLYPMPEATLDLIVERQLPCATFLFTERHTEAFNARRPTWHGTDWGRVMIVKDGNDRRLIERGAKLLLANDMGVFGPTASTSSLWGPFQSGIPDVPSHLGRSHVFWLRAALERGMDPMAALLATTRNVAEAYGRDDEVGTLEVGKRADLVALDGDPLADADHYGRVALVVKDGVEVDRERLPEHPVLTRGVEANHLL